MSRLVLSRRLVPLALLLAEGKRPPAGASQDLEDLAAIGIMRGGALATEARLLLHPLADPNRVIAISRLGESASSTATIWQRGHRATIGSSIDGTMFHLDPVDPWLIPFSVASVAQIRHPTAKDRIDNLDPASAQPPIELPSDRAVIRVSSMMRSATQHVTESDLELVETWDGYLERTPGPVTGRLLLTPRSIADVLRLIGDVTGC